MKKNIIYSIIGSIIFLISACSDDPADASKKHIYGENENPYLKTVDGASIISEVELALGHFETYTVNLTDFSDKFEQYMGMTLDQVLNGLKDGSVVFYNINTARNIWDKTPMTKGTTGWYYNAYGNISSTTNENQAATIDLDTDAKALYVNGIEGVEAGTIFSLSVGFAINGVDFDNYVRFAFNLSFTDPTVVLISLNIPDGNYSAYGIDFNDYAATIETCMGLTVKEFLDNLDYDGDTGVKTEGSIHMYVIDQNTGTWDETSNYTAESPGYWMDADGKVCNWGDSGFSVYANTKNADQMLYIGRGLDLTAGNQYLFSVGYKDTENENHYFRFIITATLE